MAADWIKMRTDLYRDPMVSIIADSLMSPDGKLARFVSQNCQRDMTVTRNVMHNVTRNVMRCATVGALVSVWGVARRRGDRVGDDLVIEKVTAEVVDDMADLPGFGEAMLESGWLVEDKNTIVFPGFFATHNADPTEKIKEQNRERQRQYRAKKDRDSHCDSNVSHAPNPSSLLSSSLKKKRGDARGEIGAVEIFEAYPKRVGKRAAIREIEAAIEAGREASELLDRVQLYAGIVGPVLGTDGERWIPNPATWFDEGRYDDDPDRWRQFAAEHAPPAVERLPGVNQPPPSETARKREILAAAAKLGEDDIRAACGRLGGCWPVEYAAGRIRRECAADMGPILENIAAAAGGDGKLVR